MNTVLPHQGVAIRFRRWSRKAYAVFASVGKLISIGNLSVQMAADSLFRKVELIKLIVVEDPQQEEVPDEESAIWLSESLVTALFVSKVVGEYPAQRHIYIIYLNG